ncbi:MAG: dienelactone hydrolase family protein [Bacteroidia bacterium]|nr:dienelactone hydrolase family protein [Bacteroidia bacterium]
MKNILLILLASFFVSEIYAQQTITFSSFDGITITADLYEIDSTSPVILLCHQARYSRGEYIETAKRLNKFGFNCLAIDQRSGKECNAVTNETAKVAASKNKPGNYIDAKPDIVAAIDFLYNKYNRRIILIGSSYSASLALILSKENEKVCATAVFSPGEYFGDAISVGKIIAGLDKPVYVTSSLNESTAVTELMKDVVSKLKVQFIPTSQGNHGSRALWASNSNNQEYWITLMAFLSKVKVLK